MITGYGSVSHLGLALTLLRQVTHLDCFSTGPQRYSVDQNVLRPLRDSRPVSATMGTADWARRAGAPGIPPNSNPARDMQGVVNRFDLGLPLHYRVSSDLKLIP